MAEFVQHESCPKCGSRDNLARYSDGSGHCFGCGYHENGEGEYTRVETEPKKKHGLIEFESFNVSRRGIRLETFEKFKYSLGDYKGERVHVANYIVEGRIVAQKVRFKNKDFRWLGDPAKAGLYGMWLWRDGGKRIVVTEGEIDAMSVSQAQQNKWPVVSIPNGAQAAKKDLSKHLEYLEQFEEIVLCFDNDEPGLLAAKECALLFTPGKARIASLPVKDANEMIKAGKSAELVAALWDAKAQRPDGVISGREVLEHGDPSPEWGDTFPWETMTKWTYGARPYEMIAYTAGTGVGKTDTLKRIMGHFIRAHGRRIGTILLEEPDLNLTISTVAGVLDGAIYHLPDVEFDKAKADMTKQLVADHMELYRVGGEVDTERVLSLIRYMVVALKCRHVFLDHITYILDGEEDEGNQSAMKRLMRSLNDLNKELPFTLHYVSHLRKATNGRKPHEEGGRIYLDDFLGGKAATQYANYAFGIERNQQADELEDRDVSIVRALKGRLSGNATGETMRLIYDRKTNTKHEVKNEEYFPQDQAGGDMF